MKTVVTKALMGIISLVFLFSCSSSRRSIAIEEGWEMLGERKVGFVRDKDELTVTSRNLFTAIRFRVEDKDIHLSYLKIYFDNGDKLEPSIDDDIPAGQDSKIIELSRDGRYISKIEFKYRSTGSILEGRANVLVFGRKFDRYRY